MKEVITGPVPVRTPDGRLDSNDPDNWLHFGQDLSDGKPLDSGCPGFGFGGPARAAELKHQKVPEPVAQPGWGATEYGE